VDDQIHSEDHEDPCREVPPVHCGRISVRRLHPQGTDGPVRVGYGHAARGDLANRSVRKPSRRHTD